MLGFDEGFGFGRTGMTNVERDKFESRTHEFHAFDFDEEASTAEEGARLPFLVLIALVVLGAFVGVVWLAYTQGVERGRAEGPQILAQRNLPAAPTATPPFTGLNIYQPAAPQKPTAPQIRHQAAARPIGPVHAATPPPALRPSSNGGAETFVPGTEPAHPFATTPPPSASEAKPAVTPKSPAGVAPKPAEILPSPAAQATGVLLQIGSYKSEAEARQSWVAFKARHPAAAGYRTDISRAELGARGTWYRLRIGPFEDKDTAAVACARLRSDGANCLIAR